MSDSQPTSANRAVFLSYASQDAAAVRRIAEALRAAGVEVWFDQNELVGGDAWDQKIRGQIASCALFVPVISAATQARLEGYFRLEWKLAAQRTHTMADEKTFLLPVVIDATRDAEAKVPTEFKAVQWTRLPGGEGVEKFCARVGRLLGGEAVAAAPEVGARPVRARDEGRGRATPLRKPALVAVGAAVLAGAVWSIWSPWKKPAPVIVPAPVVAPPARLPVEPLSEAQERARQARALVEELDATRDDYRLAEELIAQAKAKDTTDPEVSATEAHIHLSFIQRGWDLSDARRESARAAVQRALRLDPRSFEARFAQARLLNTTGPAGEESERQLRELHRERPADGRVLRGLAEIVGHLGRIDESAVLAQEAAAAPGGNPLALYNLSQAYWFAGRVAEAEAMIEASLAQRVFTGALLMNVWYKAAIRGDISQARGLIERVNPAELLEDRAAYFAYVTETFGRNPDKAIARLQAVPRDWLEDSWYRGPKGLLVGNAHQFAGRPEAARIEWEAALKLVEQRLAERPKHTRLLSARVQLLAHLGRRDEAEQRLPALRQIAGMDSSGAWFGMQSLTDSFIALGRKSEAIREIRSVIANSPRWFGAYGSTQLRLDPAYDPLRGEPAFAALVAEVEARERSTTGPAKPAGLTAAGAAAAPDDKSVAVLAFANLSDDKANEYFSDGISEELLNVLAKVPGLKVTARTSAFHFKGKDTPIPEIARQLGVAYVIEGSVRKAGDKVRITAQLIKAVDGFHVWSDTFTRDLKDVFAVQDEIAGIIAKQLSLKLGVKSNATKATVNPLAYELYLHGRQAWNQRTVEGYNLAEAKFAQAIELDPNFAAAYVGRADAWQLREYDQRRVGRWGQRGSDVLRRIQVEIEHALSLDPNLAEAHASLALNFDHMWDGMAAERELRRAIELNPNYATGFHWLGVFLWSQGWVDEARVALRRAVDLDPFSIAITSAYSRLLLDMGSPAEALAVAERTIALQPDSVRAISSKAAALLNLGRKSDALPLARKLAEGGYNLQSSRGVSVINQAGLKVELETLLARSRKEGDLFLMVKVLAAQGRWDEFFSSWAQLPLPRGESWYLFAPELDVVRHEARFLEPLKKVGLHEAHDRAQAWRKAHPPEKLK
jgi:TolB-like protein/Tfp pilus assembly protein PilF